MQKKQQLLSQIDQALKRKVQERYMKSTMTQQAMTPNSMKTDYQHEKSKQQQHQRNVYRSKNYFSKSPINQRKGEQKVKAQQTNWQNGPNKHFSNSNQVTNGRNTSQRQVQKNQIPQKQIVCKQSKLSSPSQNDNSIIKLQGLKKQNAHLKDQLQYYQKSLAGLQNQIKGLKRSEKEFYNLKLENGKLTKQIQFLQASSKNKESSRNAQGIQNIHLISDQLKKIIFQLNMSFVGKQQGSQVNILQALKMISQAISKTLEEKSKAVAKLSQFDIETILIRQSNAGLKKQIQQLRQSTQVFIQEAQQNQIVINELSNNLSVQQNQKKKLLRDYKQVIKELQTVKRQFKQIVQAGKHAKPKRQHPNRQSKDNMVESNTVIRTYDDIESQTDQNEQIQMQRQRHFEQLKDIDQVNKSLRSENQQSKKYIAMLEQQNLKNNLKFTTLKQQTSQYELLRKEQQEKSERITQDLNKLTSQLKSIQDQNNRLRQQNVTKDQDIISKLNIINELRHTGQAIQQNLANRSSQFQKGIAEKQKIIGQLSHEISRIKSVSNQLQISLSNKQIQLQNLIITKNDQFEIKLMAKNKELQNIIIQKNNQSGEQLREWKQQERKYAASIETLQASNLQKQAVIQRLTHIQNKFIPFKQEFVHKFQQIISFNKQFSLKCTQYEQAAASASSKFKEYEASTNNISHHYSQLEVFLDQQTKEKDIIKCSNDALTSKNEQLLKQGQWLKSQNLKLSFDSKNNNNLYLYYQKLSNQLKLNIDALLQKITQKQHQKEALFQKVKALQTNLNNIQADNHQLLENHHFQLNQCSQLSQKLSNALYENKLLTDKYNRIKKQSEMIDQRRVEQIGLQNYDIQRLVRENSELKNQISHLNIFHQSKHFKDNQIQQNLIILTEQNKSLVKKNQLLSQQLHMKQINKDEDKYLSELKNKHYCVLIRQMLSLMIEVDDLNGVEDFQYLLEVGSQRIMSKKRIIRDEESQKKKGQFSSEYQFQYDQPAKRYYIGTQINSSEQIMTYKPTQLDQIRQTQSRIDKTVHYSNESPKSFKFHLSPFDESESKRTERIITYFNNQIQNECKGQSN